MLSEAMLKALQSSAFTEGMEPRHVDMLAQMASEVTYSEGETLFNEGDIGDLIYLIEEGRVAIDTYVPGKGRVSILTVGPGQLLGWSAYFAKKRKTASARTVMATRAIALDAEKLRAVCKEDCGLGFEITWRIADVIADRLKATRLQLMDVFAPTPVGTID